MRNKGNAMKIESKLAAENRKYRLSHPWYLVNVQNSQALSIR